MTESKVPLDTVIKHLSDTLQQHDNTIRRLETSIDSIQNTLDTRFSNLRIENQNELDARFNTFRAETQSELQSLQGNLTTLIESKDAHWTQMSQNMQLLNNGLRELKSLMLHQHTPESPALDRPTYGDIPPTRTEQVISQSYPFGNTSNSLPYPNSSPHLLPSITIVLPPTTAISTFSGKLTESPRQFLLRIEEYSRTVNQWPHETLLRGISQFLKDDALEWYCQLYHINAIPRDWQEFRRLFWGQFHSPIRVAQQEQAWIECKQNDSETINQFVVRLRALWIEQKPDEDESEFIKHLFCKMRPEMLNLMNFSRSSSLDALIQEAQKAEEILFLCNKEQHQRDLQKFKQIPNSTYSNAQSSLQPTSFKRKMTNISPLMEIPSSPRFPSTSVRTAPTSSTSTSRTSITCWRCYEPGHYSTEYTLNAPMNSSGFPKSTAYENSSYQPLPPRYSKNN